MFQKVNFLHESLESKHFWSGYKCRGQKKFFRPLKTLVFALVIVFLTFSGLGVKFSRWGKNSLGGHK